MDIFTVTFDEDFGYLTYNLRSIAKFCRGFRDVVVMCPDKDRTLFESLHADYINHCTANAEGSPHIRPVFYDE